MGGWVVQSCELLSDFLPLIRQKQLLQFQGLKPVSCELLSDFLPLIRQKQLSQLGAYVVCVVNCFQISYLWYGRNNLRAGGGRGDTVVNCFQISYLWYGRNNLGGAISKAKSVVNCFQISYLWYGRNNVFVFSINTILLWIAFRFLTFDTAETTHKRIVIIKPMLWIAFRFLTFDTAETTEITKDNNASGLWIAFRFLTFDTAETTRADPAKARLGCELLSDFLPLIRQKQPTGHRLHLKWLWIAFRFLTFDTAETTHRGDGAVAPGLWIAFRFLTFDTAETT